MYHAAAPIMSENISMAGPLPDLVTLCMISLQVGAMSEYSQQQKKALAAPAMKLFVLGRREGR
jgi:hypothetical protein